MPGRKDDNQYPTTYQYQATDSPQQIASQFGVTTPQLLQANPGGYPFSTGQTIKIPNVPSPMVYGPPKPPVAAANTPYSQLAAQQPYKAIGSGLPSQRSQNADSARLNAQAQAVINNQVANGIPPMMVPANTPIINPQTGRPATADDMAASGYTFDPRSNSWRFNQNTGLAQLAPPNGGSPTAPNGGNSDFMNTKFMQQYAANDTDFYNQKRWDPTTKKFQKIGEIAGELNSGGVWEIIYHEKESLLR